MSPASPSRELVVICMTGHRSPGGAALNKRGVHQGLQSHLGMVGWKGYEQVSQLRGRWEPQKPGNNAGLLGPAEKLGHPPGPSSVIPDGLGQGLRPAPGRWGHINPRILHFHRRKELYRHSVG